MSAKQVLITLQAVQLVAPETLEKFDPATQLRHALDATVEEYVPAVQFVQSESRLAPVVPLYVPAGQLRQAEDTLAPGVVEYFPMPQGMQSATVLAPIVTL